MLVDSLEWKLELLADRFKRLARVAMVHDLGLDPETGIRWYPHTEGSVWMLGDAKYLVAFILEEPTTSPHEALVQVESGRFTLPSVGPPVAQPPSSQTRTTDQ